MTDNGIGADVEVQVLGRIGATVDGRAIDLGGPRQQALLAALAVRVGRTVANDVIIDAQQQRFDVTEDAIRRAAEDAAAAGLDPTPRDVALWALASAQGPVPA